MMIMRVKATRMRKKKPRLVRGMMRYIILACVIFGAALIIVKQRNSVTEMGYKLSRLKKKSDQLVRENHDLELQFTALKQPDIVQEKVKQYGLNLIRLDASQKVELPKPEPIDMQGADTKKDSNEIKPSQESRVVRK